MDVSVISQPSRSAKEKIEVLLLSHVSGMYNSECALGNEFLPERHALVRARSQLVRVNSVGKDGDLSRIFRLPGDAIDYSLPKE